MLARSQSIRDGGKSALPIQCRLFLVYLILSESPFTSSSYITLRGSDAHSCSTGEVMLTAESGVCTGDLSACVHFGMMRERLFLPKLSEIFLRLRILATSPTFKSTGPSRLGERNKNELLLLDVMEESDKSDLLKKLLLCSLLAFCSLAIWLM